MKKVICSEHAPAAIGPYAQAIAANGIVFTSGQLPIDPQPVLFRKDRSTDQAVAHQCKGDPC